MLIAISVEVSSVERSFQLSVESNPGLRCFYLTLHCDWSRKLETSSQPIKCETKNLARATWSPAFSRALGSFVALHLL